LLAYLWAKMAGLMRKAEALNVHPTTEAIKTVELEGGRMVIGTSSYRIRDLQSIELMHSLEKGKWNVVEVYVGTTDHSPTNAFSNAALKRERIGTVESTSDVAEAIRMKAAEIEIPVLEY
jgi:hypothetical protein